MWSGGWRSRSIRRSLPGGARREPGDRRCRMLRSVMVRAPVIAVSLLLVFGCTTSPAASPSMPAPVEPTEPRAPSASSEDGLVIDGKLLYDKTTAGDVHAIYLLENGVEKQVTQPGAYQRSGMAPDSRSLLVLPGGEIPPPLAGGVLGIDGT